MRRLPTALIAPIALLGLAACDNVTDPDPGIPVDISYATCLNSPATPSWFAYQDGNGSWTRVVPSANGAFNFTLTQGKGGIAIYTFDDGLFIRYASTDEIKANVPSCSGSVRNVSGNVTGYVSLDNLSIQVGASGTSIPGSTTAPAAFSVNDVDATATDLVGLRYRQAASVTTFEMTPSKVFLRRGVTGSTTPVIDFNSTTEAFTPLLRTLNLTNLAVGEQFTVFANLAMGSTLSTLSLYQNNSSFVSGSVTGNFYGLPSSALASGESQMVIVSVVKTETSGASASRFGAAVYTDVTDRTMTLGPALTAVTLTGSSRPSATYTIQAGYDNLWDVYFDQGSGASLRQVEILMTKAYLGTSATVKLEVPNLSGASGFLSSWLPVAGTQTNWDFLATNGDLSVLSNKAVARMGATRSGTFIP